MELWIRSQDKESLIQVDCLCIEKNEIDKGKYIYSSFDIVQGCITLGTYKTKERALEVLDEIEKLIKPITIFQNCQVDKSTIEKIKETGYCVVNNDARVEQFSQVFYQMPKE